MTCIVGYIDKENNNVVIGGDSAGSNGSYIVARKDTKIFRNGDFIIGGTSSFRMIQLLRFQLILPLIKKPIYEYMCTDFITAVRQCFSNNGFMQKTANGDDIGGQFLVGYKNMLFNIDDDFQVGENMLPFNACGCGADFALGALYALKDRKISIEDKVLKSLEAAGLYSCGVCGPFNILTTK